MVIGGISRKLFLRSRQQEQMHWGIMRALLYKQVINSPIIPTPNPLPSKSDHSGWSLKIGVKYFTYRLLLICWNLVGKTCIGNVFNNLEAHRLDKVYVLGKFYQVIHGGSPSSHDNMSVDHLITLCAPPYHGQSLTRNANQLAIKITSNAHWTTLLDV